MWKWLLISGVGGMAISAFFTTVNPALDTPEWVPDSVMEVVFWPVGVCVWLSGPGVNIGTPDKPFYEGTPLQLIVADLGVGVTWAFYTSLLFLVYWIRRRQRESPRTTSDV
jgi:hypothetical protein